MLALLVSLFQACMLLLAFPLCLLFFIDQLAPRAYSERREVSVELLDGIDEDIPPISEQYFCSGLAMNSVAGRDLLLAAGGAVDAACNAR